VLGGVWSCTVKLDEEYPTCAALAHKNCFGSAWLRTLPVKCAAALCTCRKECNKYDLSAAQCFLLAHHNDWSRWFASSSRSPVCCPSFSFYGWGCKRVHNKTWMWNFFSEGSHTEHPWRCSNNNDKWRAMTLWLIY